QAIFNGIRIAEEVVACEHRAFPQIHRFGCDRRLVAQIGLRFDCPDRNAGVAPAFSKLSVQPACRRRLHVEQEFVSTGYELAQNGQRLPSLGEWNDSYMRAIRDQRIGFTGTENRNIESLRIEPQDDFARIGHLRVGQTFVGEAVHKKSDLLHVARQWPPPEPTTTVFVSWAKRAPAIATREGALQSSICHSTLPCRRDAFWLLRANGAELAWSAHATRDATLEGLSRDQKGARSNSGSRVQLRSDPDVVTRGEARSDYS